MTESQIEKYLVKPGTSINLHKIDASEYKTYKGNKETAFEEVRQMNMKLDELQKIQNGEKKHKVLIVFQGMDASGKDGAIRNVFHSVNPSGVYVAHFGAPSRKELSHDFLWRIHQAAPANGEMVIFNRSHYEDVLIVRVQNLKPKEVWQRRFHHIVNFERLLYDEGTKIYKFYLHISNEEQRRRLQSRVDNPDKHWKIEPNDFKDRELWNDYIDAYNDVLNRTSRKWAPWYIIPANKKWYRDLIISNILVKELSQLKMKYPKPKIDYSGIVVK
ncbi:MAG: polyphosphate kinase 2 family protein [Candidatus Kapabacteria bacterium]|nr:polyphosphate kinase 2 family protein [Ignavibacteriota bacterium]MCW5884651.1 polyphosphate kinase 2 family protein [Candidatus Kapabacteria bacterium]